MRSMIVSVVLAAVAASATAQDTPEQVVNAYYAAIAGTNFEDAAKSLHPAELAKLKEFTIPAVTALVGTNETPSHLRPFTRDDSMEELSKLSPSDVYVRIMTWATSIQPMWIGVMQRTKTGAIGSIQDPDDAAKAHVVCRQTTSIQDTNMVRMTVISTAKDGGHWKVLPPPEVQMLANQLARQGPTMRPGTRTSVGPRRLPGTAPIQPLDRATVKPRHSEPHAPVPSTPPPPPSTPDVKAKPEGK